MEYYNDILCMPAHLYYHEYKDGLGSSEVVKENFVSYSAYKLQVHRGAINVVRQGKGEGNYALIEFDSIPKKYKKKILEKYPKPSRIASINPLFELLQTDYKAVQFFTNYRYPNGSPIPTDKVDNITLWSNNASYLNAIGELWRRHTTARMKLGKKPLVCKFFTKIAKQLKDDECQKVLPHNLPTTYRHIRAKFEEYKTERYKCLVKNLVGLTNALKITDEILRLLAYIATMPTRPYNTEVVKVYKQFMNGEIELYDTSTGEVFEPANYLDENGEIVDFTEAAVWQRLNQPGVQVRVDKYRMGAKDFNDLHRPHVHRHVPIYSFSKVSMDDRDLPVKDNVTKKRVKAYYAYDVVSGCRIGSAYSMDKNEELFVDCLRDMFVFCERNGLGVPMEVEVENHLVNKFFDDLAVMFPYLRICAPGNSQEKRAEHFNRYVKYQIEKNNHPGIGRWWLKSKYNRVSLDRVGDTYKEKMKPAERSIADDIQDTIQYNNSLHPNQKKYPKKTRLQVLLENVNPDLPKLNKSFLYKYIGFERTVSIRRNMYVQVQYAKYMLPNPQVLELLKPNNREVTAYYLPNDEGEIAEVYLYQNGEYICTAQKLVEYNEAQAERTEVDIEAKKIQDKYIAQFDKYAKGEDFSRIEALRKNNTEVPDKVEILPERKRKKKTKELVSADYGSKALDDFYD